MKYFFCIFFSLCCVCHAHPSDHVEPNLERAWDFFQKDNHNKAIALCTRWIEDERIPWIDKVHYLVARSTFHVCIKNLEGYEVDFDILNYLSFTYPLCASEMFTYYEISFNKQENH